MKNNTKILYLLVIAALLVGPVMFLTVGVTIKLFTVGDALAILTHPSTKTDAMSSLLNKFTI